MFTIEVAYATAQAQKIIPINVTNSTTVLQAITQSNISVLFPELSNMLEIPNTLLVGIFSKKIDINTYILQPHDRIEIYRPLSGTPNQKRLLRAKALPPK